ncbi:MAG: hypothetical protein R6X34_04725 [Chloroflexota bacterium]
MNQRAFHRKLFISAIFFAGVLTFFSIPVHSQESDFTALPLDPISSFVLPKPSEITTDNLNSGSIIPSNLDSGRHFGVPLPTPDVLLEKTCDPQSIHVGETMTCSITITNEGSTQLSYRVMDIVPFNFALEADSVVGGDVFHNIFITHRGKLAAGVAEDLSIGASSAPDGYRSLAAEGIPPLQNVGDEAILNFTTPSYTYLGQEYTDVAMSSNGYLIAGVGSDAETSYAPQIFPDPAVPNNVLAPFWTDLDPSAGGNLYAALLSLSDGNAWIVFEWENVPVFPGDDREPECGGVCDPDMYTFQVWIKLNTAVHEISYVYARVDGSGANSGLNIGAENADGTIGVNYTDDVNAVQALNNSPASMDDFVVVPAPGDEFGIVEIPGSPGESYTISYDATAVYQGPWFSCALLKVYQPRGITWNCLQGVVFE